MQASLKLKLPFASMCCAIGVLPGACQCIGQSCRIVLSMPVRYSGHYASGRPAGLRQNSPNFISQFNVYRSSAHKALRSLRGHAAAQDASDATVDMQRFVVAFDGLPEGAFEAWYNGKRWHAVRSSHAGVQSAKLVAEEAGGRGYVSLNLYRLPDGRMLLRPCEMSAAKVHAFVCGAQPLTK